MMKKFKKQINNEKGLTLIELLAVIVILAIIAAIAVPAIGGVIANSRDSAKLATASNILAGGKLAVLDGTCKEESNGSVSASSCDQTKLKSFVDGATGIYSVGKTTDGVWSVTHDGLTDFNSKKYTGKVPTTTLKETELNTLLGL